MKKFYLTLGAIATTAMAFGQIQFDASIDVDYGTEEVLVPASPIKSQVLFIGGTTMVETANGQTPAKQWHDFIEKTKTKKWERFETKWIPRHLLSPTMS